MSEGGFIRPGRAVIEMSVGERLLWVSIPLAFLWLAVWWALS